MGDTLIKLIIDLINPVTPFSTPIGMRKVNRSSFVYRYLSLCETVKDACVPRSSSLWLSRPRVHVVFLVTVLWWVGQALFSVVSFRLADLVVMECPCGRA